MINFENINRFLQEKLQKAKRYEVGAVEAASWLDQAGLLSDSKDRPGRELRRILRKNLIHGQEQLPNGRWTIRLVQPETKLHHTFESAGVSGRWNELDSSADISTVLSSFRNPTTVTNRDKAIQENSCIPRSSGLYAWYLRNLPEVVPVDGCTQFQDYYLMYVGISPFKEGGSGNLRQRIQTHFGKNESNNASRSTLRLSLGCLLTEFLNINLQHVDDRIHFNEGEKLLNEWMAKNALVVWEVYSCPWAIESKIIENLSLPLNLKHNTQHEFYDHLSNLRKWKKRGAK